jgi:hypothetical protein
VRYLTHVKWVKLSSPKTGGNLTPVPQKVTLFGNEIQLVKEIRSYWLRIGVEPI